MARQSTRQLGKREGVRHEQLALRYLKKNGLSLVAKNFRCRLGEIDLIMRDGECLVFVEVRFRSSNRFSSALHTVDLRKQTKIAKTASIFLAAHREYHHCPVRFDIVAFDRDVNSRNSLQWMQDAFRV